MKEYRKLKPNFKFTDNKQSLENLKNKFVNNLEAKKEKNSWKN
mgnify:CR=1 FL=1